MSDDYDRHDLDGMPLGTVLTDDESGDRLTKTAGGWECDGCWTTHSSRLLQFRRFSGVTYPQVPRPTPTAQPQSDEHPHHPTPTFGELLQALRWFAEEYSAFHKAEDRRRVETLKTLIDERIGL